MRFLSLLVVVLTLFAQGQGQQIPLVNAPEPALSSYTSSSLGAGAGSAIMPVARPAAEPKRGFEAQDWGLLGAAAGLRFLDYKSTVKFVSDPADFREVELPQGLVQNQPALGAFEASTVVANYYAYRFLVKHNHRKLARLGQTINVGVMAWAVGRNYYEINELWPRYQFPLNSELRYGGE